MFITTQQVCTEHCVSCLCLVGLSELHKAFADLSPGSISVKQEAVLQTFQDGTKQPIVWIFFFPAEKADGNLQLFYSLLVADVW